MKSNRLSTRSSRKEWRRLIPRKSSSACLLHALMHFDEAPFTTGRRHPQTSELKDFLPPNFPPLWPRENPLQQKWEAAGRREGSGVKCRQRAPQRPGGARSNGNLSHPADLLSEGTSE